VSDIWIAIVGVVIIEWIEGVADDIWVMVVVVERVWPGWSRPSRWRNWFKGKVVDELTIGFDLQNRKSAGGFQEGAFGRLRCSGPKSWGRRLW